jgi:biotin carboxyl carrier protein
MKFQVTVAGQPQSVELHRGRHGWQCAIDGVPRAVDVAEVAPGILSLLVEGRSFTVGVERVGEGYRLHTRGTDLVAGVENPRRWSGRGGSALEGSSRQEIIAPMPGKIVRLLVEEQQQVEDGQGLVVVEAMKMQNAIPAHKNGVVERILVREGDTVEHGEVLLVVA